MFQKTLLAAVIGLSPVAFAESAFNVITCKTTGDSFGNPTSVTVTITFAERLSLAYTKTDILAEGNLTLPMPGYARLVALNDASTTIEFNSDSAGVAPFRTLMRIELETRALLGEQQLLGGGKADVLETSAMLKPEYVLSQCSGSLK